MKLISERKVKSMASVGACVLGCLIFSACGVKAKPLPPLEPAEIGRGVPTYKRAAEQAKPAVVPDSMSVKPSPTPDRRGQ
jgi:hypothetical protein